MSNIPTVSDTRRAFYQHHKRPINSIYRQVIQELMVEMHLLSVNVDFQPDPIYYVGVCQSFDQFMNGYTPENDKDSIFRALCQGINSNPDEYRQQAGALLGFVEGKSAEDLINWLSNPQHQDDLANNVVEGWKSALHRDKFKYSRLFGIGFYALLAKTDEEMVKDEEKMAKLIAPITEKLQLPIEKLKKDVDLYKSNLNKISQMLTVIAETIEASKKKRLNLEKPAESNS